MSSAFVTDTITKGDIVTLFRLGRVDFPNPADVTTPWGATRNVGVYEEGGGVVDIPCVKEVLRSELLSGYESGRVKPTLGETIARYLPSELVKRFENAVDALIRKDHFRFQPFDCPALVELNPAWVELRREDGAVSVAIVGDRVQRVGDNDVNALVWSTGQPLWSLGHVKHK